LSTLTWCSKKDSVRVHTIIGAPGIGKTTVAYKVAEVISRNVSGGVHGFSFESIPSELDFLRQLYATLQLDASGFDNTVTLDMCLPTIKRALERHGRTVFFIDNAETLLTSNGHPMAILLQRLIREIPSLTYLVTSRDTPLGWQITEIEHTIQVLPSDAAVALFTDCLRRRTDEAKSVIGRAMIQKICGRIGWHALSVTLLASQFDHSTFPLEIFEQDAIKYLLDTRSRDGTLQLDLCIRRSISTIDEELQMALAMAALLDSVFREDDFSELISSVFVESNQKPRPYFHRGKAYLRDLVDRSLVTQSTNNYGNIDFHILPPILEYVLHPFGPSHTPLYQRVLTILEKLPGYHPSHDATTLATLATIYRHRGKYAEAGPLYQQALSIQEKSLGLDHLDVADTLNDLALLYKSQGKYVEASPLIQRALVIAEKSLGHDHPNVANMMKNLALLYLRRGKICGSLTIVSTCISHRGEIIEI